jgi:sterol desaturase/sphingolipid hydroxylase (fatty acid hydroxylase superfamily)
MITTPDPVPEQADRPTRPGLAIGLTTVAVVLAAIVLRGPAVIGVAALFLIFVPLEKLFAFRPQKVFRRGFLTDLTHLLVNNLLITIGVLAVLVVALIPFFWLRSLNIAGLLPPAPGTLLAVLVVLIGGYWGHRLTHRVPLLWRFHAVHHSIEDMDWLASGRLHPLDQVFTHAVVVVPLYLLGFSGAVFGGVVVFFTFLALFQHANVRLRFPVVRWVINTPEWHHWHHAIDAEAVNKNFGVPIVDKLFGTAYLPRGKRPSGFGTPDPVPPVGYLSQLAYPFTKPARESSPR